jgi:hypothetical protein
MATDPPVPTLSTSTVTTSGGRSNALSFDVIATFQHVVSGVTEAAFALAAPPAGVTATTSAVQSSDGRVWRLPVVLSGTGTTSAVFPLTFGIAARYAGISPPNAASSPATFTFSIGTRFPFVLPPWLSLCVLYLPPPSRP